MPEIQRRRAVTVNIGGVRAGSDSPVVVQSMTNTDTADVESTVQQVAALARAGSEMVRVTVNNDDAAKAVPYIVEELAKKGWTTPIIGDWQRWVRKGRSRAQAGRMAQEEKTPLFSWRAREQLLSQRILVLDGVLDDDNGTLLTAQLLTLAADDPGADIALWIHSPGGSIPSMLAIRDVMRLVPCDVSTLALGLACSAGQFLLSAGVKGKRSALPHARILMHQGSSGIGGTAVEIEVQAGDLRHTRDTVLGLIASDTGQSVERIFEDSLHDRWYTAEQAREYGFVDQVVESFGQVMPARRHRIGLTA